MNETVSRLKRIFARTPGERAFDRCLFPLAVFFVLSIVVGIIGESVLAVSLPSPVWLTWLGFALGLILAVLWFRALFSVISAWRDPSATILRFVSCVLLLPFAYLAFTFVSIPFR